jgi:hypothetical protein
MPEVGESNIEIAHQLNETHKHGSPQISLKVEILEVFEAIVLALVAITTAWSGYQAARWDGRQDFLYGRASKLRVEAQGLEVRGNQVRFYDASTVAAWLQAQAHGDTKLAELFERRLMPELRPAFQAWKDTDPIHNPNAPASPMLMPQYHDATMEQSANLNQRAAEFFEQGTEAREYADRYVRVTVFLATVLLLAALSQRFRTPQIRVGLIVLGFLILISQVWRVVTLPRS